jgi:hypothetical protein
MDSRYEGSSMLTVLALSAITVMLACRFFHNAK